MAIVDNFILSFWQGLVEPLLVLPFKKNARDLKTPHYYQNKAKYEKVDKFLSTNKFVTGDPTLADFYVAEGSFYFQTLYP